MLLTNPVSVGEVDTDSCCGEAVATEHSHGDNLCRYTLNLILAVEQSPEEGGDPSESFIHNLNTQIANAVADQYDSNNVIFDNDPTTGHGIGYTVTSEGIKTAIDNAIGGLSIPEELNDLSDVVINNPQANQALIFDLTDPDNPVVTNGTVSTVGSIDDLSDVDTTGKATGDSLRYNGLEWVAKPTTYKIDKADFDLISDFTPYANSKIVVPDEPNLNPTANDIEYSSGVSVKQAIDGSIAKANVLKFSESKTSNYGVVTTNIPTTKCLLGYYFGSYGLIPYKHSSGNWYFNVVNAENGYIVPKVGETDTLVVYYYSFDMT